MTLGTILDAVLGDIINFIILFFVIKYAIISAFKTMKKQNLIEKDK